MVSKKRYWIGIGLLVLACLLMHLFAKSVENLRLLYYVLEAFGYYTGYLISTLSTVLWVVLAVAIIALDIFAVVLMRSGYYKKFVCPKCAVKDEPILLKGRDEYQCRHCDYQSVIKKRYRVIPVCIALVSIISCFMFPYVQGLFLRIPGGLNTVTLNERDTVRYSYYSWNPVTNEEHYDPTVLIQFNKYSPGEAQFYVKFVDLNDSNNEYVVAAPIKFEEKYGSVGISILGGKAFQLNSTGFISYSTKDIPGYNLEWNNWRDLRFKIVIFNEKESKTFPLYFDKYKSP